MAIEIERGEQNVGRLSAMHVCPVCSRLERTSAKSWDSHPICVKCQRVLDAMRAGRIVTDSIIHPRRVACQEGTRVPRDREGEVKGEMMMGSDGVFSSKVFGESGIAAEGQIPASGLEEAVRDPLITERQPFPKLVVEGFGFKVRNRSGFATKFWPRQSLVLDEFPDRGSNVMIAPNTPEGPFWAGQADRRRRILARDGYAYIAHFSQDPPPDEAALALAREYVREHQRDGGAEPAPDPLTKVSYERSQTAGVVMDEAAGVGIRVRPDGFDTTEADEAARLARINAAPMYSPDGEPIDKE